ncbi:hypothetical protein AMECASPLE_033169, partial [Ameca splendens]
MTARNYVIIRAPRHVQNAVISGKTGVACTDEQRRTLSTLLLPVYLLLKALDHLIILAHHYPPSSVSRWVTGELVPISSSLWAGGGVHPGQVRSDPEKIKAVIKRFCSGWESSYNYPVRGKLNHFCLFCCMLSWSSTHRCRLTWSLGFIPGDYSAPMW